MDLISAATLLFLVMDPLGNIPIFLSILEKVPEDRRRRVLIRELFLALLVLLAFLFFGKYLLGFLGLSEHAIRIAGGIILFLIALKMVFPVPRYSADVVARPVRPRVEMAEGISAPLTECPRCMTSGLP
ncbi:MAG: MarC family protein, partial [Pseudomonadota bacterium]